jgi:hypothetical protein
MTFRDDEGKNKINLYATETSNESHYSVTDIKYLLRMIIARCDKRIRTTCFSRNVSCSGSVLIQHRYVVTYWEL